MDEPAQAALIGPVESHWFIEEDEKNAGANYLIGVCLAFFEIAPPSSNPELAPEIQRLRHLVQRLSEDLVPRHWAFRSLANKEEWKLARELAGALLRRSKTMVRPPRKPFKIENIIRVDHFAHASVVRKFSK